MGRARVRQTNGERPQRGPPQLEGEVRRVAGAAEAPRPTLIKPFKGFPAAAKRAGHRRLRSWSTYNVSQIRFPREKASRLSTTYQRETQQKESSTGQRCQPHCFWMLRNGQKKGQKIATADPKRTSEINAAQGRTGRASRVN